MPDHGLMPGNNLTVEGVPPIPHTLAATLRRYTEFRTAVFADWHPERREMLIRTRFADTMQVHQVAFPGGDRRQMTFFADAVGAASYCPADGGAYFIFSKDTGGNEFAQTYRYDFADGALTLLTDGYAKNSHGLWSNAGNRLIYSSTRRTGKDVDFYVIDPAHSESDRLLVAQEGGGWYALDWSPDDSQIVVAEYLSVNESYLWLLDAQTGEKSLLTPKGGPKVSYKSAKFAKDSNTLYVVTDRDSEWARLMKLDLSSGALTPLTPELGWEVEEFDLSPDGSKIALVTNEDGISILRLLDMATGRLTVPQDIPAGIIGSLRWHASGADLAFGLVSARSPADVYSLNAETGAIERWTHSETGGFSTETFAVPELVRWPSFDGRSISGFLSRPSAAKFPGKRPVIIVIHGGPESQARPGFLGQSNYYLNELGIALLYPNVRGSSGYGKTFLDLDNGFRREDTYKDIGALLEWIAAQPELDADKIMVSGGSYGGHMTLAVSTLYSNQIACAVDVVGMSNLVTFLENTESYRRDLRRVEYGDERDPEMRAFLERIAPLNNADKIGKPLFIIQGKNDPRVPASEALQMAATVRKNEIPVWFLMADDEGHGFAKKKNIEFQFYATALFVQTYLLNSF